MAITLQTAVEYAKTKGIGIGIDLGVHSFCFLSSNCPKAVELRKILLKAGINLSEIVPVSSGSDFPVNTELPEIPNLSTVKIDLFGQQIELDVSSLVGHQLEQGTQEYLQSLTKTKRSLLGYGKALQGAYKHALKCLDEKHILPQLLVGREELLETTALITAEGENYLILLPATYQPEYIVTQGIRYELAEHHKAQLRKDCYLEFTIKGVEKTVLGVDLVDERGKFIPHYHGDRGKTCWGSVRYGAFRSLTQLYQLAIQLIGALSTINGDSLLNRRPPDMPTYDELMGEAVKLGREGEIRQQEAPQEAPQERRGWGDW